MKDTRCPICGKSLRGNEKDTFYPFCGERCQLIDLGQWLSGGYAIPGKPRAEDEREPPAAEDGE